MLNSDFFTSLMFRDGKNLDASDKIVSGVSLPLHPKQWMVEVHKVFAISLARMQRTIHIIAVGPEEETRGYRKVGRDWGFDLCGFTKVQTVGWKNINLMELIALMFLVLALWILMTKVGDGIVLMWLFADILSPVVKQTWIFVKLLRQKVVIFLYYRVQGIQWLRAWWSR